MITKRLILALLIVISAITVSCKKYPDGPLISFRTAKGRLYGTHTLTKYTVNGVDSLSLYSDSLSLTFRFFYDNTYNNADICMIGETRKDGKWCELSWFWVLVDNKKTFKVSKSIASYSGGTGPFSSGITPEWEILRLKHHDIIMQTTYNGKVYYIELN